MYLQNKSYHHDRLRTIKPLVDDRMSPDIFRRSIDADGFLMNNKQRNKFKRKVEGEN